MWGLYFCWYNCCQRTMDTGKLLTVAATWLRSKQTSPGAMPGLVSFRVRQRKESLTWLASWWSWSWLEFILMKQPTAALKQGRAEASSDQVGGLIQMDLLFSLFIDK